MNRRDRRSFLKSSAALAAGVSTIGAAALVPAGVNNRIRVAVVGREGYMLFPDYSSYYTFLGRDRRPGPAKSVAGEPMMDTDHFRNWIAAVRSRDARDLAADIEEGHLSSALCHLAKVAQRTRRTVAFDPQAERFAGDEEANRLLSRPYRPPCVVPDRL